MEPDFDIDKIAFGAGPVKDTPPKSPTTKRESRRSVGRPSHQSKQNELRQEIEGVLKLALLPLLMRDQHVIQDESGNIDVYSCANVYVSMDEKTGITLTPDGKRLADAAAAVVIDSPFLMKVFTMGDEFGKWLALLMAIQPFAMTVFHNHVTAKRIQDSGQG